MASVNSLVAMLVTLCFFLVVMVVPSEAGKWSEWRNVTACNAKPCGCWGDKKQCEKGTRVQVRVCEFDGINGCQFDEDGSMQHIDCEMHICPGWSEFKAKPGAPCKPCDSGDANGTRTTVRLCDNPPPVHPKVLCQTARKEVTLSEEGEEACECEAEQTTMAEWTAPTIEPTTNKPECCADYEDYYNNVNNVPTNANNEFDDLESTTRGITLSPEVAEYMAEFYDDDVATNGTDYGGVACVPCDKSGNPIRNTTSAGGFESTTADPGNADYPDYEDSEEDNMEDEEVDEDYNEEY